MKKETKRLTRSTEMSGRVHQGTAQVVGALTCIKLLAFVAWLLWP